MVGGTDKHGCVGEAKIEALVAAMSGWNKVVKRRSKVISKS